MLYVSLFVLSLQFRSWRGQKRNPAATVRQSKQPARPPEQKSKTPGFHSKIGRSFLASILSASTPGTFFKSSMVLKFPFFSRY
jgi:hypothetical protein